MKELNNKTRPKKLLFIASLGTLIEYYDYALFTIFFPILSPLFFPAGSLSESLSKGYVILMIAMLARPIGAFLLGHIGDHIGRSKALLYSMSGIAFATLAIGLAPSYAAIGIWGAIIISVAKVIQIFCFGGEYNGAGIYIVEHAEKENELLFGSFLSIAGLIGGLIASITGIVLTSSFLPTWSWRVSFIVGGLIGFICILYRKNLFEISHFKNADLKQHRLINLIKWFPLELLAGIFIGAAATAQITTVFIFLNPMLMAKGYLNHHELMLLQFVLFLMATVMLLVTAIAVRKKSPSSVMMVACLMTAVCVYPLLWIIDQGNLYGIIFSLLLLTVINEASFAPSNAYLKHLFPMQYRYRGASISFCIGMSLFGGLTPVVENYLYKITGTFSSIAIWLSFIYASAFLIVYIVWKKQSYLNIESSLAESVAE